MAFTRIDKADYNGKGVIGLPDAPQLSTNAMQEKFEEISLDVIIPKHNTLIDELESATGASNIGTKNGNVQSEIDAFDGKIATFNGDISQLKSDMTQAQGDIATLQSGVNTNKTDIAALQSDNTTNKADIATNKANITTLQNENTTNKANITKNANDISALQTSVTTNANNIASLQNDNTTNKADIASLKSDNVTLKGKAHVHANKSVIDALSKDSATGNLMFEGNPISGGGSGNTDTYGHVKVGSVTIDASGDDTIELVAGSNVTLTPNANSKSVTISASGGGGGTSTGDMLKSDFVLPGGTGQVLSAKEADHATNADNATSANSASTATIADKAMAMFDGTNEIPANQLMQKSVYDADDDGVVDNAEHATNADNVGNADTSLLEKLSDSSGTLNYNGNALMLEAAQFANQAKLGEFVVNRIGNNVKELALHSNITTKLSKVDTPDNLSVELAKKIDKPASATNGQVLTYNGTSNEWEAQDSKGGGSGTARVNVSGIPSGYSLYYYDVSDPSTKNPVSGTSVEVGFGTYRFYASNGSDNTSETEVIVDTLKIYNITLKVIYAVHISMSEADPDSAVTFPSGYDNSDFSDNAYMDLSGGSFHYGDWVNAFFMPKSCMLKFDGTVDYYLNEDDETKKEDGTPSDVANINYGGNAMVEWGKIYFGFKGDADGNGYTFIVSDSPSEGLDCYCNIDANKNEIDHFYTPKYFGSNDSSNRLRSISGQSNYVKQTGTTELSHAKANGNGWSTECYGDWTLIKHLLVLMSKSLNIQAKYGYGRCSTSNSTAIGQGTMNGKGRFWGDNSQTNGVKIFGMENWYGNLWRRIEGYVTNSSGVQLVKMCYGTRDGSTADAYSTDGTGYVSMGTTSGTSGSGIQTMHVNNKCGVVPKALTGNTSPTTYFSDGYWYNNSCYALIGGSWGDGLRVGAFYSYIAYAVSEALASFGAAVSCKPLSA